ncbi:MAG: dipeptidase [Acidobacteriota bacterium]|nr:dipeptidase [Acidobacteriota bacterium]
MKRTFAVLLIFAFVLLAEKSLLAQNAPKASSPTTSSNDAVTERAKKIHFSSLVLDTHIDVTPKLQGNWKFDERHNTGHIDLPRMKDGGLNGLFFSIYMSGTVTGHKAVNDAVQRIAAVHKLAEDLPDKVMLCRTAADVRLAHRQGKIAALMGMEGGHMINNSLPVLRMYAELGVRYLTLTHSVNTDWADSSGDQPKHNGLTDFGKDVVRELNKLGVMVDISHVSDKTFWDALEVSKAPMIASHSSCRAISGHPRNMTDEMIKALAAKGGVIQINYLDSFIDPDLFAYSQKTQAAQRELRQKYQNEPRETAFPKIREELATQFGAPPKASWERIVEHIDHAVKLVGVNHVGLGSDFDGGSMPVGMEDCTKLPLITDALLKKGYKESDIRKILGLNTIRLLADVERVSKQLRQAK